MCALEFKQRPKTGILVDRANPKESSLSSVSPALKFQPSWIFFALLLESQETSFSTEEGESRALWCMNNSKKKKKMPFLLCLSSGTDNRPGAAGDYISCPLKVPSVQGYCHSPALLEGGPAKSRLPWKHAAVCLFLTWGGALRLRRQLPTAFLEWRAAAANERADAA